jgi:hypothetical protein
MHSNYAEHVTKAANNYSWDVHATCVSETDSVYDYTASISITISVFIPELQVFEIPPFFW